MNDFSCYKRYLKSSLVGLLGVGLLSAQLNARSFIDGDLDIQKFSYEDSLLKKGDPNGVHKVQVRNYNGKMEEVQIHSEIRIKLKPGVNQEVKKGKIYSAQINEGMCYAFRMLQTGDTTSLDPKEFPKQSREKKGRVVTLIGQNEVPYLILETDCQLEDIAKLSLVGNFDGTGFLTEYKFKDAKPIY
ncbi:hypothetical protein [Helicobacter acinonychis]|uniref:Uncharacterized protein n=1 Tax=Helicobacter acinonychis (strain Sheeba) TaxID=382638 RepID=Q17YN7_HELAH|nr:hypothetical protein [Helicobacter acinonychis]CAJ99239.1 conserved hypothetical protein [Helicobacter acinonychis str. Sheeba]STP04643.1 Uncharacterised protein [Helicobacter acinonychis]